MRCKPERFFSFKRGEFLQDFPDTVEALDDPAGLLVAGGSLDDKTLLDAYKKGIFPWGEDKGLPLWWAPDPRTVLYPADINISRSLSKTIRRNKYKVTFDTKFETVISACGPGRNENTWISKNVVNAYTNLFYRGLAHSVECWFEDKLCGGLYGVTLGRIFFGESMYSSKRDASKVALAYLCEKLVSWEYQLVDCQVYSEHLTKMGATSLSKSVFQDILNDQITKEPSKNAWRV
jgi:leucyl/phenylalanyl-tRNA---protein transferase